MKGVGLTAKQITAILTVSVVGGAGSLNAASDTVYLNYGATVAEECSLSLAGNTEPLSFGILGEESTANSLSVDVLLNCNAPFKYTISSENGGALKVAEAPVVSILSDAFHRQINYSATFSTGLEDGNLASINKLCSKALSNFEGNLCSGNTGTSIAINKAAQLNLVLDSTINKVFVAGVYQDRITISITTEL